MSDRAELEELRARARLADLEAKASGGKSSNPDSDEVGIPEDILRSIPGGVVKGITSLLGLPGDIASFMKADKPKEDSSYLSRFESAINPGNVLPTTKNIQDFASSALGGFYKPRTLAGEYTETAASFLPNALNAPSLAKGALRVAIPSITSETAGQLTKDTEYEPYARVAGAAIGGGAQGLSEGLAAESTVSRGIPKTSELKTQGGNEYKSFASNPVKITPEADAVLFDTYGKKAIEHALGEAEINREKDLADELKALLGDDPAIRPKQLRTDTADKIRQSFDSLADSANTPNEARGWSDRSEAMETTVQQTPDINDARNLWSRFRKSQIIDSAVNRARDAEGTPAGFGDKAQAMRREFLKITRSKKFDFFNEDEREAIKAVANGTLTSNILQQLGKYSPVRNHVAGWLEMLGVVGGHPEALGFAAGAEIARQGSMAATKRAGRLASETVRAGKPVKAKIGQNVVREAGRSTLAARGQSYPFDIWDDSP